MLFNEPGILIRASGRLVLKASLCRIFEMYTRVRLILFLPPKFNPYCETERELFSKAHSCRETHLPTRDKFFCVFSLKLQEKSTQSVLEHRTPASDKTNELRRRKKNTSSNRRVCWANCFWRCKVVIIQRPKNFWMVTLGLSWWPLNAWEHLPKSLKSWNITSLFSKTASILLKYKESSKIFIIKTSASRERDAGKGE